MTENQESVITITFENAATRKEWKVPAVSSELMRDYVGQAAKQLFQPVPTRVGIATKDGQIVQDWSEKSVSAVLETYRTNVFILGSPDQLGLDIAINITKEEFKKADAQFEMLLQIYYAGLDPTKTQGKNLEELEGILNKIKTKISKEN